MPRIFISYARSDLDFVRSLHDRLEAVGCEVWYDQEQVPGLPWPTQLMHWLQQADAVAVVVSARSVNSDSVQNEILLAKNQGKLILPVLLEDVDPTGELWLLILRLQWIDARQQRDSLPAFAKALAIKVALPPPPPPTLPFQEVFDSLIAEKTDGFVGRAYVFSAIESFLARQPKGYFTIEADPGAGKSALLAHYVAQHPTCLAHFNIRSLGLNRAEQFLERMCKLLIAHANLPHKDLPPEATRDGTYFAKLLKEASVQRQPDTPIIIALDALDEVDATSTPVGTNTLYLPPTLPEGVYIIMTRRRMDRLAFRVNPGVPMEVCDLMRYHDESRRDIQAYIRHAIDRRPALRTWIDQHDLQVTPELKVERFIELLSDKSENNFMYLRYVLPELETGAYQNLTVTAIPQGLQSYYEDHWQRMRHNAGDDTWFQYKLPIIVALTEVKTPVSMDLIADFSGVAERSRISAVLSEWTAFLHADQATFQDILVNRYRIYHASFHDFMAQKEEVAEERINRKATKKRIRDRLVQEYHQRKTER